MCGDISLLTGLCVVWFFITKTRGDVALTNLTRGYHDGFTNLFCKKCSEYNAEISGNANVCRCQSGHKQSGSLFLRSKRKCTDGEELMGKGPTSCLFWGRQQAAEVIDTEDVNSTYIFGKPIAFSCQSTQSIVFLDALGKWQPFNLSENVLKVIKGPLMSQEKIKVTQQSPSLTNLSGHILKLNLTCKNLASRSVQRCLIFKVKGALNFPLCNYTAPTTTPLSPPTTSAITTSTVTNGSMTPSKTTTPSITRTAPAPSGGIIAAIAIIGIVLFLALIGAFVFLFKHHYICKSRSRQAVAREFDDFAVINNSGQQTYRIQEEPLYIELPDAYPSNMQIAGNSVKKREGKQSTEQLVLSNSFVKNASLLRARPLPSRPDLEEIVRTKNSTSPVYQNDGHEVKDQRDASMVLTNPVVQETLSGSDFDDFPPAREERQTEADHRHHHHQQHHHDTADGAEEDEDVDYQGLAKGKRAKSMFICPSCNESSDYQRLSRPGQCPHDRNNGGREKSASFYENLTLERGTRESFYASPSRDDEDEERNADQVPEYQVLESEETESDEVLDESVDHDYNVLEEPEPANGELDEDNNKIGDPRSFDDENSGVPLEPSVILDTEDNPAYAVPLKKTVTEKPEPVRSELDEDNNKTRDPRPVDENPEEPFEPPLFLKIDNNPLYSLPWKNNITEESGRKRSHSM